MTRNEIEYMWKVASNDPNHDTNWNDAVVIAFAKLVAQHEREQCKKLCEWKTGNQFVDEAVAVCYRAIDQRGQA
jgi:hypothetical protein